MDGCAWMSLCSFWQSVRGEELVCGSAKQPTRGGTEKDDDIQQGRVAAEEEEAGEEVQFAFV